MQKGLPFPLAKPSVYLLLALGVCLRILAATRGHNYDFDSYLIVIQIMDAGGNVYAETSRYNYGPIWFNILHFLYIISAKNTLIFRYILAFFLSAVDLGIFFILFKKFSFKPAAYFFLSPVSIIITGFHNQFDNLAVLTALIAVDLMGDKFKERLNKHQIAGLFLLGISLTTKHLFFIFPLWLAAKHRSFSQKIIILLVPTCVFILSFLPYWNEGKEGIIHNVFLYNSYNNEFFYNLIISDFLKQSISSKVVWLLILIAGAYIYKQESLVKTLLYYTGVLVGVSPSISNQYLAIPIPYLSVENNLFSALYTVVATINLFIDYDGLHFPALATLGVFDRNFYYLILVILIISHLFRDRITSLLTKTGPKRHNEGTTI